MLLNFIYLFGSSKGLYTLSINDTPLSRITVAKGFLLSVFTVIDLIALGSFLSTATRKPPPEAPVKPLGP
jgi:uncharacterized membrane protein